MAGWSDTSMPHARTSRLRAVMALVAILLIASSASATAAPPPDVGARQAVIVTLDDGVAAPGAVAREVARRFGGSTTYVYEHAVRGFAAELPAGAVAALGRDPRVVAVEPDHVVTTAAPIVPTGIDRTEADLYLGLDTSAAIPDTYAGKVQVAILDTGIQLDHPDLNVVLGVDCTLTTGSGPPWSRQSYCGTGPGRGADGNGHGTHVAGTAAGFNNLAGMAPGADLYAVKVLDNSGSGSMSGIIAGIDWVTANAATIDVANMSLGCSNCMTTALDTALNNSTAAGVVYVAAAGNSNANAGNFSPANHPRVISVGALADFDGRPGGEGAPTCRSDEDDTRANFSNFGSSVDLAAPGVCIRSSVPGSGYDTFSGTSMASPHVAGAAALQVAANGSPSNWTGVSAVKTGILTDWTVEPGHTCGYTPDDGKPIGPLLVLDRVNCGQTGGGGDDPGGDDPGGEDPGGDDPGGDDGDGIVLTNLGSVNNGSTWTANVQIATAGGVAVQGTWSTGGSDTCTTSGSGTCAVSASGIPKRVGSTTFTVTAVDGEPVTGPSTTVTKP